MIRENGYHDARKIVETAKTLILKSSEDWSKIFTETKNSTTFDNFFFKSWREKEI
jgi:hypothetical protein